MLQHVVSCAELLILPNRYKSKCVIFITYVVVTNASSGRLCSKLGERVTSRDQVFSYLNLKQDFFFLYLGNKLG